VNRADFQELAELHLQHARALLDAKLYSGAYYMCGYVVECALKACICKKTDQFDFPLSPEDSKKAWSHKFKSLISLAEIDAQLDAERKGDKILDVYWNLAGEWSEESRYQKQRLNEARALYTAVSDPVHGVLACIRRYW
jgi:HEPN domain-containing protein